MPVYRYRQNSPSAKLIGDAVSNPITMGSMSPPVFQDITADAGDKTDLDEVMAHEGWTYTATDPATTVDEDQGSTEIPTAQIREVAISGKPFTSVAAALADITDASSTKPYVVRIYPGVYTESPFSLKAGVNVQGIGNWLDVILTTNNNSDNFITGVAASALTNVMIDGPTGAGYAAIDYTATGSSSLMLDNIVIRKGYYGIHCHPASYGNFMAHQVVNRYASSQINQFIRVTDFGVATLLGCAFMSGPGTAVIQGYYASGANAKITMDNCQFRCSGATDAVFADNGALIRMNGSSLASGVNAIHVGATGTGTRISAAGVTIDDTFTKDIWVETSTANVTFTGTAHRAKIIDGGCTFAAQVADNTSGDQGVAIYGESWVGPAQLPLHIWTDAASVVGVASGGGLERVSGLQVKVLAGTGFIPSPSGHPSYVEWPDTTLTLADDTNVLRIIVDNTGTPQSSAGYDEFTDIIIGSCATSGGAVTFLTDTPVETPNTAGKFWDYVGEVIGPVNVTGSVTTKNTTPSLQLDVTSGEYYVFNDHKHPTAGTAITFRYWYRDGAGKWTVVSGQTSINVTNYDDGSGTLATIPAGEWKRDLLFVSESTGSGTEYHVVYGQETYAAQVDAITNPIPPDVLTFGACRLAGIVVQKSATDIAEILDQRPRLGQLASGATGVTSHGDLSGLSSDDHTQYQLRSEKDSASGYAGLDGSGKIASSVLNLATAAGTTITTSSAAVGSGPKLAYEDHGHSVSTGTPVAIGTANSAGVATSVAKSDHVHSHGVQTDGTLHAAVIAAGASGFMTGADKTKLDASANASWIWGNGNGIGTSTTLRYLTPGRSDGNAPTTAVGFRATVQGTLQNLYVRHNTVGSGGNVTYTLFINGSTSGIAVTMTAAAADGNNTANTAAVAKGDLIEIRITKAAIIASSPQEVIATAEVKA